MNTIFFGLWIGGLALLLSSAGPGSVATQEVISTAQETQAQAKAPDEDFDVQKRGPVHEAFARPAQQNPQPGPVISKQPPKPLKEVPPDRKPEGDNIEWIPGYWAWDAERTD